MYNIKGQQTNGRLVTLTSNQPKYPGNPVCSQLVYLMMFPLAIMIHMNIGSYSLGILTEQGEMDGVISGLLLLCKFQVIIKGVCPFKLLFVLSCYK